MCQGLVLVGVVLDDALGEDVEGPSKEEVVGGVANNVYLKIERNIGDGACDVPRQSEGLVDVAVSGLKVYTYRRIVAET
jgi:hypothetical protein